MAVTLFALPASSIALLFSLALGLTDATPWAEPAVQTLAYRAHEWSPRPTGVTNEPAKLFKRSSLDVGICGWLGGNEALPAQCSSRSSCVHDTIHGVVGCCTTDGACLQGVYTNCLDNKSGGWAATPVVKNDGVTMCPGTSQCYRNTYAGDYYQYSCGDPASATTISTTYDGKPTDERLQVVFTGVTFDPSVTISAPVLAPTPPAGQPDAAAGAVSPPSPTTTAEAPSGSKSSAGTVAGGTVGGIAGVAIIGALAFFLLRRRSNRSNSRRRMGSGGFFERKEPFAQPFEPIHQGYNNRHDYITPMTGNTYGDREFERDTSYHGGGGMPENKRGPPTSFDIARTNPFSDDAEAGPVSSAPHGYSNVAGQNPFSDQHRMIPPKPLRERAYNDQPPRLTPSPNTPSDPMRAQTMPLVNELDTEEEFSRTWAKASAEHGFDGDWDDEDYDDDEEDDDSEHGHIQIATRVNLVPPPPSTKSLDREVQSESLRQVDPLPWDAPHLRTARSDISSLHHSPEKENRNMNSAPAQYESHNASNSTISSYRKTPPPAMQAAALTRPTHPLEQEQSLLDEDEKTPMGRDRQDSVDSTYLPAYNLTRESSTRSSLRPGTSKTSLQEKRTSAANGSDGWRGSGMDGYGASPAWSGIGGGWLENQSGMAMSTVAEVPTPDEEPYELPGSGPSEVLKRPTTSLQSLHFDSTSTVKRRPVSAAPTMNSTVGSQRKGRSESVKSGQSWFTAVDEEE